MAKKKATQTKTIQNRRARHDYELGDSLVVGMELTDAETKALRMGQGSLRGAFVNVRDNEIYLYNALVGQVAGINLTDTEKTRVRKLLAKRREIDALIEAKQQGKTIVPTEILTRGRYIKLRIAVGRGRKQYDKRQNLKARDESREMKRAIKFSR
jgi:SsrA-binding protein